MCPQNARIAILLEQPLEAVGIGMRVQYQLVLFRQRDHAPWHRQVGVRAVDVELADRDVAAACEPLFEERDDRIVADPGRDVAATAVRP
jgi:hypothetical protein